MTSRLTIRDPSQEPLLARFYDELYLPAFAHQREPLAAWLGQLWGAAPAPYELTITLALDGDGLDARIAGGIVGERYPASACAIVTYMVVAPHARRAGLGRALLHDACAAFVAGGARAVVGEVSTADTAEARDRLARFLRWGARVVDHPYVQPDLGHGRDRALCLVVFEPRDTSALEGATLRAFLREFYAVTERVDPDADAELGPLLAAIPAQVPLRRR